MPLTKVNSILVDGAINTDSSGNVGIGTSSPSYKLDVNGQIRGDFIVRATGGSVGTYIVANSGGGFGAVGTATNHPVLFNTNDTERMRIDTSGNLLVNTTTATHSGITSRCILKSANDVLGVVTDSGNTQAVRFTNGTTAVGSINLTTSATSYATSSDYRLKENVAPMTGALAKVAQLKPCTYTWKSTGEASQGFIAHELQEVVPECVTGEKDAVNEDGSIKSQGIDTSFLVATLTAAIQELKAELDTVKTELATLKANP